MANPRFGAMQTESGQGFAWSRNSQSNRLLPWSNDPVADPPGDAIYIRDDQSGVSWTPTPLPIRELDAYRCRHGQGYTIFEHNSHAIEQELTTFVPLDERAGGPEGAPVRVQRLRLRNASSRRRRLAVFGYGEWVLGGTREETQMHVVTSWDAEGRLLLARNAYHPDFGSRVALRRLQRLPHQLQRRPGRVPRAATAPPPAPRRWGARASPGAPGPASIPATPCTPPWRSSRGRAPR